MSSEVAAPAAAAAASAPSAPVAIVYASPPVPAESLSPAPQSIVEVEEDPTMKEALADQREKAPLIAEFRTKLAPFFAEHPDSQLVREAQGSDRVVYRFLQARKFDLPKAELLFKDAIKMRDEKKLDGILHRPIPKGLEYKIVSKHGWHGFDRYGRPIFIKNTGLQNFKALYSTGELEERVAYNTYLNEYLRYVIMPAANARIGHAYAIDQVVTIVNLKDFGFHCIKKHNYDWVQAIALINNTLYPETAGSTWIINAPRVFSMVWSIVKGWIDERTRNKVLILSGDGSKEIREKIGDESFRNLPKAIGGECTCLPDGEVPEFGMACMLGHPQSKAFIEHMKRRNDEAGLSADVPGKIELKDQPEEKETETTEE